MSRAPTSQDPALPVMKSVYTNLSISAAGQSNNDLSQVRATYSYPSAAESYQYEQQAYSRGQQVFVPQGHIHYNQQLYQQQQQQQHQQQQQQQVMPSLLHNMPPNMPPNGGKRAAGALPQTQLKRQNMNMYSATGQQYEQGFSGGGISYGNDDDEDDDEDGDSSDNNAGGRGRGKRGTKSSASAMVVQSSADDNRLHSKRFVWPEVLHRDFVAAIFDVGLKNSSPNAILDFMSSAANPDVTTERIKSHLQKFRLNRTKSQADFMVSYDESLKGLNAPDTGKPGANGAPNYNAKGPYALPFSGDIAAQLTYASVHFPDDEELRAQQQARAQLGGRGAAGVVRDVQALASDITEEEKKTPAGASILHLLNLYGTLKTLVVSQRPVNDARAGQASFGANPGGGPKDNAALYAPSHGRHPSNIMGSAGLMSAYPDDASFGRDGGVDRDGFFSSFNSRDHRNSSYVNESSMAFQRQLQNQMRAFKENEAKKWGGADSGDAASGSSHSALRDTTTSGGGGTTNKNSSNSSNSSSSSSSSSSAAAGSTARTADHGATDPLLSVGGAGFSEGLSNAPQYGSNRNPIPSPPRKGSNLERQDSNSFSLDPDAWLSNQPPKEARTSSGATGEGLFELHNIWDDTTTTEDLFQFLAE